MVKNYIKKFLFPWKQKGKINLKIMLTTFFQMDSVEGLLFYFFQMFIHWCNQPKLHKYLLRAKYEVSHV